MENLINQCKIITYAFTFIILSFGLSWAEPCGDGIGPTHSSNVSGSGEYVIYSDFSAYLPFDATNFSSDCVDGYTWVKTIGTLSETTTGNNLIFTPPDPETVEGCNEKATIKLSCGSTEVASITVIMKKEPTYYDPYAVVRETMEVLFVGDAWCSSQTHEGKLGYLRFRGYNCKGQLIAECYKTDCRNDGTYPRLCLTFLPNGSPYQIGYNIGGSSADIECGECEE